MQDVRNIIKSLQRQIVRHLDTIYFSSLGIAYITQPHTPRLLRLMFDVYNNVELHTMLIPALNIFILSLTGLRNRN